jgi:hypothetical protein
MLKLVRMHGDSSRPVKSPQYDATLDSVLTTVFHAINGVFYER